MKILINVKTTLRSMISTGVITIAFFILFPIALAAFMGFLEDSTSDGLKLNTIDMVIEDNDNTEMSKGLISFLGSDEVKDIVNIKDGDDSKASKLIIPSGYSESVVNKKNNNIVIECNNSDHSTAISVLKVMLDNYHQGIYSTLSNESAEKLYDISQDKAIESQSIVTDKKDMKETYAVNIFEFVVSMLLYTLIEGSYAVTSKNFSNRLKSTPVSFGELVMCDWVSYVVYTFIIMAAYITAFRVTNVAFQGNILMLLLLILAAAIFISSVANAIAGIFGEKFGKLAGVVVFILPIIGMKMFTGKGNILAKFAPTSYVIKAFESYFISGSLAESSKYIFIILGVSLVSMLLLFIKGIIVERRRRVCA